jgi:hypothetical protein
VERGVRADTLVTALDADHGVVDSACTNPKYTAHSCGAFLVSPASVTGAVAFQSETTDASSAGLLAVPAFAVPTNNGPANTRANSSFQARVLGAEDAVRAFPAGYDPGVQHPCPSARIRLVGRADADGVSALDRTRRPDADVEMLVPVVGGAREAGRFAPGGPTTVKNRAAPSWRSSAHQESGESVPWSGLWYEPGSAGAGGAVEVPLRTG